ncbi:ornithine cyclodeaminase [Fangia hongkongensis]|nr:ornithine cyclodeaminase [Fangia hongkongensis]MBK2124050.1 ornithine cyclodeaminase [Fangia hongkongensis]
MIKVISVENLSQLVKRHTLKQFLLDLMATVKSDFVRWQEFDKIPRPAFHVPDGVIELMPTADKELFAYKYVNGHPKNPLENKQTIIATGQLSKVSDGHPLLISEMTVLTGLRTAATSALATDFLAREDAKTLALIGTGAQSDFQALATSLVRDIKTIRYHDIDPKAMERFYKNMSVYDFELVPCSSNEEAVKGADIITVCTACKAHAKVIENAWVKEGVHINGLGGDCPGKTELEHSILPRAKVVVEFFEQSFIEGEIQTLTEEEAQKIVYAELWQVLNGDKKGRVSDEEITIFDSVGFALEDFSALKLTYELSQKYDIGTGLNMIPTLSDPKDLFSVLNHANPKDPALAIQSKEEAL